MSLNFRDDLVKASEKQFEAQIDKHRINIVLLKAISMVDHMLSGIIMIEINT